MKKVIRNGKVAVLISPDYGAGWYTWNDRKEELLYSPKVVKMVEEKRLHEIDEDWIKENLGLEDIYLGGVGDLVIRWLPVGTSFKIDEFDGHETLLTLEDLTLKA